MVKLIPVFLPAKQCKKILPARNIIHQAVVMKVNPVYSRIFCVNKSTLASAGINAVIPDQVLVLVRNMGREEGDELNSSEELDILTKITVVLGSVDDLALGRHINDLLEFALMAS